MQAVCILENVQKVKSDLEFLPTLYLLVQPVSNLLEIKLCKLHTCRAS